MPLDPKTELKAPEKKEWPIIPQDIYQAQITDITEFDDEFRGQIKEKLKFEFTIIEEGEFYGRKLWARGSKVSPCPSTNNKPPLTWKVVSAVLKHPLTMDEGRSFTIAQMNSLIGKQVRISVSVTPPKDGKQYNNCESFLMAKVELPPFDESKIKKDEAAHKPTPAEIVQQQASGGKFTPKQPLSADPGPSDEQDIGF